MDVTAQSLGQAIQALEKACPALHPDVVKNGCLTSHYVCAVNGGQITRDPETPLRHGDTVVLLGAQAGG